MKKIYRIAFIFPGIYMGGSEKVLFNLASAFQKAGHSITFFSLKPPGIELPGNLPFPLLLPPHCRKLPKAIQLWIFRRLIQKEQKQNGEFDLVLSNLHTRASLLSKNTERLFYYLHLIDMTADPKYPKRLSRYYSKKQVIAVSEDVKKAFLQIPNMHPSSVTMIYNGFDFKKIRQEADAFLPNINEPYLIHVGRFDRQKRHDLLFDAYRRLNNPPKLVLLVTVTEELKKLILKYNLANRIILPGLQSNPFPWMKHAKALILSSDFEALPTVLIESLICGTPVISTDCPSGPREILKGELSHWLTPLNDPITLAQKIQEVIDHPYTIRDEQIDRFNMEAILPKYLSLLNKN
jgi:glycosyltransferase involved in cell wall biosynthesis